MKNKRSVLMLAVIWTALTLSGCVSQTGKTAMLTAQELVEAGAYPEAAKQCAVAIGNGVKDKDFVHMSEVLKSYNSALTLYKDGKLDDAEEKMSEIVDYSDLAMASDIEKLKDKIKTKKDKIAKIDKTLEEAKDLYDDEDYDKAKEEMLKLDENSMTSEQKTAYKKLQNKIDGKLQKEENDSKNAVQNTAQNVAVNTYNAVDYSKYDSSLSKAYIAGAESGSVYFWNSSSGSGYYTTLSNGTVVYTTNHRSNGRTLVKVNGRYGWLTSKYVNVGSVSTYTTNYHIQGASSGSVYVWTSAYGDEYYTTISNGTVVYPTGNTGGGRVQIRWGNGYAWITAQYVG